MGDFEYAVIGAVTIDRIESAKYAGGTVSYAGLWACSREVRSALVTRGSSSKFIDGLRTLGAAVSIEESAETTCFEHSIFAGQSRKLRVTSYCGEILVKDVADLIGRVRLVHFAPVLGEVNLEVVRSLRAADIRVATIQGWLRRLDENGMVIQEITGELEAIAEYIDIAIFSEEDVAELPEVASMLASRGVVVVETKGQRGALLRNSSSSRVFLESDHIVNCANTTGAGDIFAAALSRSLLCGDTVEQAVVEGNRGAAEFLENRAQWLDNMAL